jgi:hypothetical protein
LEGRPKSEETRQNKKTGLALAIARGESISSWGNDEDLVNDDRALRNLAVLSHQFGPAGISPA